MKQILEEAEAHFEETRDIIVENPYQLFELGHIRDFGATYKHALTGLLKPFLRRTVKFSPRILSMDIKRFSEKFKITSNLLSPVQPLIDANVNFILAGGKMIDYVNNKLIPESLGDYDLFFTNGEHLLSAKELLQKLGYSILSDKSHVVELFNVQNGIKIQLIMTIFSCAEEVLTTFDIRACAVAMCDSEIWWTSGALKDIRDKKVVLQTLRPNRLAWVRPLKYYSKGYTIAPTDLALISYCLLMSFENENPFDAFDFFTDRKCQYSSASDVSMYDIFSLP